MDGIAVDEGGVDDPVEQHAAPLPADGRDQEAQDRGIGHVPTAASRRMTTARIRFTNRVHQVGFVITLTS